MRYLRVAVAAVTAVAGLSALAAPPAAAAELYDETFADPQVKHLGVWSAPSTQGTHQPCLTAATTAVQGSLPVCKAVTSGAKKPDPAGSGAFQLTDNSLKNSGALLLNRALDARQGLHIEFDMFHYDAYPNKYDAKKAQGGDGMSFFLIDGETPDVKPGAAGGYLSYKDLPGAVVGVGFDQFGNFSNKGYWPAGDKGPGNIPNNIVIRGAEKTNYQYLKGVPSPAPLAVGSAKTRTEAKRTVNIDLSTANMLNVYVDYYDGSGKREIIKNVDLDNFTGQPKLPETIKLGFGGATGDAGAIHEIAGFKVTSLDPDLKTTMTAQGTFQAGGTGAYKIDVANKPDAGPTVGPITTTFKAPAGTTVRSASGPGWTCTPSGGQATCTRTAKLRPGDTAPIDVVINIPAGASGDLTATATADTKDEHKPADNTATVTTTLPKPAIQTGLKVDIKSTPNPYVPGGVVTYTATVTNDGPSAAKGATFGADWPGLMDGIPWTCKASAGSACPAPTGRGDISGVKVDVAAKGTVTFTVSCLLPLIAKGSQEATATIAPPAGATDSNCPVKCTAKDTNPGTVPALVPGGARRRA